MTSCRTALCCNTAKRPKACCRCWHFTQGNYIGQNRSLLHQSPETQGRLAERLHQVQVEHEANGHTLQAAWQSRLHQVQVEHEANGHALQATWQSHFAKLWIKLASKVKLSRQPGGANLSKLRLELAPKVKHSKAWQSYLHQALRRRLEHGLQLFQSPLHILVLDVKTLLRRVLELMPSNSLGVRRQ